MPFRSKRQWRAAMAGKIPGISKEKAREWAHETKVPFRRLPERAPGQKGEPTLRSKGAGVEDALVGLCIKLAMPGTSLVKSTPRRVGLFRGRATSNWLKPPGGSEIKHVINPRRNLLNAMTAFKA